MSKCIREWFDGGIGENDKIYSVEWEGLDKEDRKTEWEYWKGCFCERYIENP